MGLFFLGWFIGALFFGLNLLGVFLLWADWVVLPFRWVHQYGQCRVFLRGGGIFEAMGDGLDLTLLGGSESGVREVE
jgi:hypothetical protein